MRWFYHDGSKQSGPVDEAELIKLIGSGIIKGTSQVWKEGSPAWVVLAETELKVHLPPEPPPLPERKAIPGPDVDWRKSQPASPKVKTESSYNPIIGIIAVVCGLYLWIALDSKKTGGMLIGTGLAYIVWIR